jgi:hypothetical protein
MDVRLHDGLLCAKVGGRIPKVCLLCGATKDVVRRTQEYPIGASYGTGAGAVGGVVGALTAQSLRHVDRAVAVGVIVGLVAVVSVVAFVAHRATPRVSMELPLCTRCDGRWAEAEGRRVWIISAIGLFLALVLAGFALDAMVLMVAGLAVILGAVGFAKVTDQAQRFAQVGFVQKEEIGFRVGPEIAAKIVERAQRRADQASKDASEAAAPKDEAP